MEGTEVISNNIQVSFTVLVSVISSLCAVIATMFIMYRKDKSEDTKKIIEMATEMTNVAASSHDAIINSTAAMVANSERINQNSSLLIAVKTLIESTKQK